MTEYAHPVTLIGNGFSALATARQLLKRGRRVRIVGPEAGFGRGTAYGAARAEHLLNVPAERMGWDVDASRLATHPVLGTLIEAGMALPDPLGLGLACDAHGQVLGRNGPTAGLHLIGNLRRGECWESSAVPELRAQAAALAERLAPG